MTTFIAVCIGILTLLQVIWTVAIVMAMLQVRKAAVAVENLAVAAKQPVDKLIYVADKIQDIASLMTGWYKALWLGIMKAVEMWAKPRHEPEGARDKEEVRQ
jgi:hypothetical protein